jgi:hypothetical protein
MTRFGDCLAVAKPSLVSVAILLLAIPPFAEAQYQQSSVLTAQVVTRALFLHYSIGSQDRDSLQQLVRGCVSVEVIYAAELRKVRLFWPDVPFATTLVRNRLTCDPGTQRRQLARFVGGTPVETLNDPDDSAVIPFLADIGKSVLFDAHHFSPLSSEYSVRVRSRVITPDGEYLSKGDSVSITLPHR